MIDFIEVDLIPIAIKNQLRMIKKVSTCTEVCAITLLAAMWSIGLFRDFTTGLVLSLILLSLTTPLLLPGYMFDKVNQSTVRCNSDRIHILDKKGGCWRSIDCNTITAVRIKEVSGFFYGHNKDMFRDKYICIFLNGATNMPDVPYAKLFTEKDFVMFAYNDEALQWILEKYPNQARRSRAREDDPIV